MKRLMVMSCVLSLALCGRALAAGIAASAHYRVAQQVALPGDEFWDYLTFDAHGKRLFVAHGNRVQVTNPEGKLIAEIPETPGVHGVAIADDVGRGYISAGRSGTIIAFDLKTLTKTLDIKATGENPDAILYDAFTHRVFSFNGRGRNVTVIDAKTNAVIATIPVDAKPEAGVTDLAGRVFVNLEDKSSIAVIDAKRGTLETSWPIAACKDPTGLAIDRKHQRLFSVCSNKIMTIVDSKSGKEVATVPIGGRVDGAVFDDATQLAFASGGDGTLTVIHEDSPNSFSVVETVATQTGARTLTLDAATHRIYSAAAKYVADPSKPGQRPTIEPGSFSVLIIDPKPE